MREMLVRYRFFFFFNVFNICTFSFSMSKRRHERVRSYFTNMLIIGTEKISSVCFDVKLYETMFFLYISQVLVHCLAGLIFKCIGLCIL